MGTSAFAIANAFIRKGCEVGNPVTHMKLQKLVYFAQAWNLAIKDAPLFNETIEAWKYGPVVREVYQYYMGFGNGPILAYEKNLTLSKDDQALIDEVWRVYGRFSPAQLSTLSHEKNGPWDGKKHRELIPQDQIREFFKKKLATPQAASV